MIWPMLKDRSLIAYTWQHEGKEGVKIEKSVDKKRRLLETAVYIIDRQVLDKLFDRQ